MKYPSSTWIYPKTSVFGHFLNWQNTTDVPTGFVYGNNVAEYRDMPVSFTHKPRKRGKWSEGGEWCSFKRKVVNEDQHVDRVYRVNNHTAYRGKFTHNSALTQAAIVPPRTEIVLQMYDMRELGARAWNAMRPAAPDFTVAQSLLELKDIPKMLKQAASLFNNRFRRAALSRGPKFHREAGSWALALEFGYLPILADIQKFFAALKTRDKSFRQLLRDNGRRIHRRVDLSKSIPASYKLFTYSTPYNPNLHPSLVTQCYVTGRESRTERWINEYEETWAEATFRYFLPKGPKGLVDIDKVRRRIMGGRVTPSTLYNLVPWTWLADYFTDLGQFVEAVSGGVEENLYAEHFYIMRTYQKTVFFRSNQAVYTHHTGTWIRPSAERTIQDTYKFRVKGSIFGFGLSQDSLSGKQKFILGALGLSRL